MPRASDHLHVNQTPLRDQKSFCMSCYSQLKNKKCNSDQQEIQRILQFIQSFISVLIFQESFLCQRFLGNGHWNFVDAYSINIE